MNDEQSKRLAEAADALIQAAEALEDARDALNDRRFESELDRERLAAAQQMANRLDGAGKKIEDALRRGTIAAAALARQGSYTRYREAAASVKEGRSQARGVPDQDGAANKRARGQDSLARLEAALNAAAVIVFGD